MGFVSFLRDMGSGRAWLIAVAVTAAVAVALVILKRLAAGSLRRLAARTETRIDDYLVDLLASSSPLFLMPLAVLAGAQALTPSAAAQLWIFRVAIAGLLVQGAIWANKLITFGLDELARRTDDPASVTTIRALAYLGRIALWILAGLLILDNLGVEVTPLVAGLGVGGIAVALAVQNVLSDLFASLSIVLDKPFVIGDFIVVDNLTGTVEHIGLKTTRIRSVDGEQIVFSNTDLLKSRIKNLKRMRERRALFNFGVPYDTPAGAVAAIPGYVREAVAAQPKTRLDRAHLKELGPTALTYEVVYFVNDPDQTVYMDVQQAINLALLERFRREGIAFSAPSAAAFAKAPARP